MRRPSLSKASLFEEGLFQQGISSLGGIDEAGRGALAGPVVAAVCILPHDAHIPDLNDSKLLTPHKRETLFNVIQEKALAWSVAFIDERTIDRINIHHATLLAMKEAVQKLSPLPQYLLIDGKFPIETSVPQKAIVDGDAKCQVIAAASILAKVSRDRFMIACEKDYPRFSFSIHKGYGTKRHREEIRQVGFTPLHRLSFKMK